MLQREGRYLSTIDLCGSKWSLLVGPQVAGWNEEAHRVAQETGLDIAVHSIGAQAEWKGCFKERYGIGATGAVLVRPGGFVAWRSLARVDHPPGQLVSAVVSLLGK